MIKRNTALVLGAGASHDYGLPTGEELKGHIVNLINPDSVYPEEISKATGIEANHLKNLARGLSGSSLGSIDSWLERRSEFVEAGKVCICYAMAKKENPNRLWAPEWYDFLWQRMTEETRGIEDLLKNEVYIITFNYDRSLEAFLLPPQSGSLITPS